MGCLRNSADNSTTPNGLGDDPNRFASSLYVDDSGSGAPWLPASFGRNRVHGPIVASLSSSVRNVDALGNPWSMVLSRAGCRLRQCATLPYADRAILAGGGAPQGPVAPLSASGHGGCSATDVLASDGGRRRRQPRHWQRCCGDGLTPLSFWSRPPAGP